LVAAAEQPTASAAASVALLTAHVPPTATAPGAADVADYAAAKRAAGDAGDAAAAPLAAQEAGQGKPAESPPPPPLSPTGVAKSEVDERGVGEVALCFDANLPLGLELAGVTLAVASVAASGQADDLGVSVGWRVARVGGTPVATLGAFHRAVQKAAVSAAAAAAAAAADAATDATADAAVAEESSRSASELVLVFVRDARDTNTSVLTKGQFRNSVSSVALLHDDGSSMFHHKRKRALFSRPRAYAFVCKVFGARGGGSEGEDEYEFSDEEDDLLEGYLLKKGANRLSPWQSRWFVAQGHYLR
jgi:hypothetical protein